jgi:hypothetical protein
MSEWGRAMFVTPGVIVDGKLVTNDLVKINLGIRILLGSSFYDDWEAEPMFVSQGFNSDIRYNFYYPRWAYDDYRDMMAELSARNGWQYLDLWDFIPPDEFTNSAVHMTPQATQRLAQKIGEFILNGWSN